MFKKQGGLWSGGENSWAFTGKSQKSGTDSASKEKRKIERRSKGYYIKIPLYRGGGNVHKYGRVIQPEEKGKEH